MAWYRGDLHVHSARSHGGEMSPARVVAAARDAGLDFIAVTEHNTTDTYAEFAALAGDDLLVIPGREVTTGNGHWLTLGPDALRVAAHPFAPYPGGALRHRFGEFDAIEVWNGAWRSDLPWQADNEAALQAWGATGAAVPAVGNSDTHLEGQIGTPQTVVRAEELSAAGVLAAVRAGRCWIAGSAAVDLSFTARPGAVRFAVRGVPGGILSLHSERGEVLRAAASDAVEWRGEAAFVRAEVRHPDGAMAALTNPVPA